MDESKQGRYNLLILSTISLLVAAGIGISSLILNIIVLHKVDNLNSPESTSTPIPVAPAPSGPFSMCYNGTTNQSDDYKEAADYLLSAMDESIDPCEDFYAFSCNKFLQKTNLTELKTPLYGTFLQTQIDVNKVIVDSLLQIDVNNQSISKTERITRILMDSCVANAKLSTPLDHSNIIANEFRQWFGGIPYFGQKLAANVDIFAAVGQIEQTHAVGTLISSKASVDFKNVKRNALYLSQPTLSLPHVFYVLPQFIDKLNNRVDSVDQMLSAFAKSQNRSGLDTLSTAQSVVQFEVLIALASWPDELKRNYEPQYNPYNLSSIQMAYSSIGWMSYISALFDGVQNNADFANNNYVISEPSYFSWLNSVIEGNTVELDTIVNYIITQVLFDDANFIGDAYSRIAIEADYVQYNKRSIKDVLRLPKYSNLATDDSDEISCIDLITSYMPFGTGYVYVKAVGKIRDDVTADVQKQTELIISNFQGMVATLQWMTTASKATAATKSAALIKNYGWPREMFQDFVNFTNVDAYNVVDYGDILTADVNNYYAIMKLLRRGYQRNEQFRLLTLPADRYHFGFSPAWVNGWYQPMRNSITFPFAALNPPYYKLGYPQAVNYAGQGGTGGHEYSHGYDDHGVQYGSDGSLANCNWNQCSWMDSNSSAGFIDMAQCVVTQYSTKCCPEKIGNVHCANGATTQGENIADLGGQQAAYRAYREYISQIEHEEDRLPGLEQYTPNQIFWITYGYTFCMKQTDDNLVNQILTDPHAPASCRVNNVMQDIPEFGQDFGCRRGSTLYPLPQNRCKVWVGQ